MYMDSRNFDPSGKTICPECGEAFFPVLGERDQTLKIQDQYPNAALWEREQLITGLCSQKCWNDHIGIGEYEEYDPDETPDGE